MFRAFILGERVRSRLLSMPDGDRRVTNLLHLAELLHRAANEQRFGPAALLRWFVAQRTVEGVSREDDSVLRLERDDDAVQIITMHRSKGLEFEVVFCPFAYGETEKKLASQLLVFHDPTQEHRLTLDLGSEDRDKHKALLAREHLAEQVRLLYVALTRAIHACHFVWGRFNQCEVSAAAWLLHRPPPSEEDDCVECLRTHMKELEPEQFTADLSSLCDLAPESVEVTPLPGFEAPIYRPPQAETRLSGSPRIFQGSIDREWCVSSFSSLIEGCDAERRDYDRAPATAEVVAVEAPSGIHAFPAGRRAGICLHELFEELDFTNDEAIEPLVQQKLTAYSFAPADWAQPVTECIRRTLSARLPGGFSLKDVPQSACLPELEFHLPAQRLDARALRQLLEEDDSLQFDNRRGWLKGFIDLVFEQRGRFYIVDWKSNRLGTDTRAYSTEAMATTMTRQRYTLQLHLYTVALHRYLQWRLADYDYDRHFGGVLYFFVRGIDPADESLGVHFEKPDKTTIENLSLWLDGNQ